MSSSKINFLKHGLPSFLPNDPPWPKGNQPLIWPGTYDLLGLSEKKNELGQSLSVTLLLELEDTKRK